MPNYDGQMVEWVVQSGDPAAKKVSTLRKRGIDTIVLPRSVYLGMMVTEPLPELRENDPLLAFRIREHDCRHLLGVDLSTI